MANPIYAEVIPRELTAVQESELESQVSPSWYVNENGSLDIQKLIRAFQGYYREHSGSWVERYGHREAGASACAARLPAPRDQQRRAHHARVCRRTRTDGPARGMAAAGGAAGIRCKQARHRMQGAEERVQPEECDPPRNGANGSVHGSLWCGVGGHLLVFDMREGRSWEERLFRKDPQPDRPPITVWGL